MSERKPLPTTQRVDPPQYLATYLEKQNRSTGAETPDDENTPLYLRRFRQRQEGGSATQALPPLHERVGLGMQQALSEDNRTKEISAPPGTHAARELAGPHVRPHRLQAGEPGRDDRDPER